jgi:hypothetical protein
MNLKVSFPFANSHKVNKSSNFAEKNVNIIKYRTYYCFDTLGTDFEFDCSNS